MRHPLTTPISGLALALGLAALVAPIAPTARADGPLRLAPGFTPHPLVVKGITQKAEMYPDKLGVTGCGGGMTGKNPAFTFELTQDMPEMVMRFELDGGFTPAGTSMILFFPSGGFLCPDKYEVHRTNWPKGTYKLYLQAYSVGMQTNVRFEVPSRSKGDVLAARDAAPTVTFDSGGPVMSQRFTFAATRAAENQDVQLGCAKKTEGVMPLAKVEVPRAYAAMSLSERGDGGKVRAVTLVAEDGKTCIDSGAVPAGSYTLWALLDRDAPPATIHVEVDDTKEPLRFGAPAREVVLGELPTPLVIAGTIAPREARPSRDDGSCRGDGALAPDVHLVAKEPRQKVTLRVVSAARADQELRLWGPLESMKHNQRPVCHPRATTIDIMEGTYAVWVVGEAGAEFQLAVMDSDTTIDRHHLPSVPPPDLPLAERALDRHYPFYGGDYPREATEKSDQVHFFTHAPDGLFVYPRVDVKAEGSSLALTKGEPLLLTNAGRERSTVLRADGRYTSVATQLLGVERLAPGFPAVHAPAPLESTGSAIDAAGPEDDKTVKAYVAVEDKVVGCIGDYLAKHDPTWGTGHEVYAIRGGQVTNVGTQVYKAAQARCGQGKLDLAKSKLMKALAATRNARWAAVHAAARARFQE